MIYMIKIDKDSAYRGINISYIVIDKILVI